MKKFLWIIPTLPLLWVVGYGIHLHRMLTRITDRPGVTLTIEPYRLQPYTGPTREINLGYAAFQLPAKWEGELVRVGRSAAMIKRPGDKNLGFMAPASLRIDATDEFAKSYLEFFGEDVPPFHDLRKKSLAAQPVSVWDVPRLGRRKVLQEAVLLSFKAMQVGVIDRVRLYETSARAVWIESGPKIMVVSIYSRATDINHSLVLPIEDSGGIDELLGALVPSYRLLTTDVSENNIESLLASTGLAPPAPTGPAETSPQETARLQELAGEIRHRRMLQQLSPR